MTPRLGLSMFSKRFSALAAFALLGCYSVDATAPSGDVGFMDAGPEAVPDSGRLRDGSAGDDGAGGGDVGTPDDVGEDGDRGMTPDAAEDAGPADTGVDGSTPLDSGAVDVGVVVDSGEPDAGRTPDAGANCKNTCTDVECGPLPDGCGGTFDCGECYVPGQYCRKEAAIVHRGSVKGGVEIVKAEHPEYFDFADTKGESVKVLDTEGFRVAVVAALNAGGLAASLTGDDHEIKVRGDVAFEEFYMIRTSSDYSAYTYVTTCTPADF